MNARFFLPSCALALTLLAGCGYHLGGLRCKELQDMNTFCVNMFGNHSLHPGVAMQMTTALTDSLQRDGTFRMASPDKCDFKIDGVVTGVGRRSLTANSQDSYISSEIELVVHVSYRVTDREGNVIKNGTTRADGSYFNTTGNIQTARETALSYATRKAAENIVYALTIP